MTNMYKDKLLTVRHVWGSHNSDNVVPKPFTVSKHLLLLTSG